MKHGWEYKKFTDVCDVQYGFAFDSKFFTDDENAMPLIRIRDVMRGYSETFYNGEIPNGYLINEGDYLVGMDGEFNIGRWGKRPGLLNQRVCKMSSSSKLLDNQYMYYFMKVCLKSIEDETPFVTVKHLSAKRINLIKIPLPPLLTQQSIASELDKINELIRLKKEQLKDYDNLVQSIFYEMFGDPVVNEKGWEVKRITDLCVEISAGGDASKHEIKKTKDEIFYVPVYSNGIDKDGLYGYSNHATIIQPAITLAARGTIGAAFIRTEPYIPIIRLVSVIPDLSKISLIYLLYILKQTEWDRTGGTIPQLPVPKVKQLTLPLPPLPLQQLFAQRIELIEKQKAEIQTTMADLETLLASRMQYWFD